MSDFGWLRGLLGHYRRKGVLIDTNLLVPYLVGAYDPRQLNNCRATRDFPAADLELLQSVIQEFERIITTPHILTEVSNLTGKLPDAVLPDFRRTFAGWVKGVTEVRDASSSILVEDTAFPRMGLTDVAIARTIPGSFLVLTSEVELYVLLLQRGVDVVNFNHLRELRD